ncbi:unnamed protein product [Meloidogyne enterolobii]|uniref:Uncharacterized protein n=1 Tax=Meloidogyne enterolobii TaxID=390850 RepID=A0ACB0Z5V7_MELEN
MSRTRYIILLSLNPELFHIIISIHYAYSFPVTTFLSILTLSIYNYFLFVCNSFQLPLLFLPEYTKPSKDNSINISLPSLFKLSLLNFLRIFISTIF